MKGPIFRLGDVARIDSGIPMPEQDIVWLLNLDTIEQQTGRLLDRLMVPREQIGSSTIGFDADCVLYSKLRPNLNKVLLPDRPGVATSEILPLRVIAKTMSKEYLCWFLRSPAFVTYAQSRTAGAKMPRLGSKALLEARIPVPLPSRQREIVAQLEGLQKIFQLSNSELSRLRQLAKSRFVEMFGNPVANSHDLPLKKMGDILTGIDSGKSFVCENTPRTGNHPAVLKLSAVSIDGYKPDENKSLPSADMFVEKAEVKPGDLLFTRKNTPELVGTCVYVKNTPPFLMMPDLVFRLNPTEEVSRQYLCALINHSLFRPKIQDLASGSAKSMSNISKERLSKLDVPVPPMELQNEYAAFIDQLDKSEFAIRKRLEKARLLYRAKLQEFFG